MIFDNKAYLVKNSTRNHTNTKNYSILNDNYIFEATFKYRPTSKDTECCVLGRTGYKYGLFVVESEALRQPEDIFSKVNNTIKWCWFRTEGENIVYDDIFFGIDNNSDKLKHHIKWWKTFIKNNSPVKIKDTVLEGLVNRWGFFNGMFSLDQIEDQELFKWAESIEVGRNKTGSYITDTTTVSVVREDSFFKLYVNDIFYYQKKVGNIVDYSNQTVCIGIDDPYKDKESSLWFNGEIFDVKVYNDSDKSNHTLYCSFDFETKTHFKLFDLSRNGNHAELFETEEFKELKNKEFNTYSRPAKIVKTD